MHLKLKSDLWISKFWYNILSFIVSIFALFMIFFQRSPFNSLKLFASYEYEVYYGHIQAAHTKRLYIDTIVFVKINFDELKQNIVSVWPLLGIRIYHINQNNGLMLYIWLRFDGRASKDYVKFLLSFLTKVWINIQIGSFIAVVSCR